MRSCRILDGVPHPFVQTDGRYLLNWGAIHPAYHVNWLGVLQSPSVRMVGTPLWRYSQHQRVKVEAEAIGLERSRFLLRPPLCQKVTNRFQTFLLGALASVSLLSYNLLFARQSFECLIFFKSNNILTVAFSFVSAELGSVDIHQPIISLGEDEAAIPMNFTILANAMCRNWNDRKLWCYLWRSDWRGLKDSGTNL
jgi:hypothetical protein